MFSYFRKLKFVFFGTPEFAAIILEKLIDAGFIPRAVVCNPDKPVGRKKIITPPPTKVLAEKYKIDVFQPETLANYKLQITNYKPDFFIVAAYAKIIPQEILTIPRLGSIGVHPSLLPRYRGSSPIQSAILSGDDKTGITLFLMDEKIDHGPILIQRLLNDELGIMNYEELFQKLAEQGADLLIKFLGSPTSQKLINNIKEAGFLNIELKPQDESQATYTKKFKTEDGFVKPQDLEKAQIEGGGIAIEIDRKIRALNPEPGVWTFGLSSGRARRMKILEAEIKDNKLILKKIQWEGKKPQILA